MKIIRVATFVFITPCLYFTAPAFGGDSLDVDTTVVKVLEPLRIRGERVEREVPPGEIRVGEFVVDSRDGLGADDQGPLLPSTKVNVNSRGEALFMVRGLPERHVRVFQDGIPLTVPWDERSDLSMTPMEAIVELRSTRGVRSVLDGPNALAGVVHLVPLELERSGYRTRATFRAGEAEAIGAGAYHALRQGSWHALFALSRRERAAFLVPAGYAPPFNQGAGRSRTNSDMEQTAALARVGRDLPGDGGVTLSLHGSDGSKGVPPETYKEDARFWRYPVRRRFLAGLAADVPFGEGDRWRLNAGASADLFRQEIREFDDARYETPALLPGTAYETDRDRTVYGSARLTRETDAGAATVQAVLRRTGHVESLEVGGAEERYVQNLGSFTGELIRPIGAGWKGTAGAGYEFASTPETGDKPARGGAEAPVFHGRIDHEGAGGLRFYASASRRSRFPSLRELFSGALGRFVPNPDLGPERQDLYETGAGLSGGRFDGAVSLFASYVRDGIEKVLVREGEGEFQRINVEKIRTLGVELVTTWRPVPGLALTADHTILNARREEGGDYGAAVEDRPDYLTSLSGSYAHVSGPGIIVEAIVTGPRHSADTTDEVDGLRRLPAQGSWNVRLFFRSSRPGAFPPESEIFLRVNNLFDQRVDAQTGLVEPGRAMMAGVKFDFGG